jgi:Mn2+/Fe2+ NRAMP family transporter
MFTGRKDLTGNLVNRTATKSVIILIVAVAIVLNAYPPYGTFTGG